MEAALKAKGVIAMRIKMTILVAAYVAISTLLLAIAHQSSGPVTTQKTDRVAGTGNQTLFLVERFAG
jgi:hypothetical protein